MSAGDTQGVCEGTHAPLLSPPCMYTVSPLSPPWAACLPISVCSPASTLLTCSLPDNNCSHSAAISLGGLPPDTVVNYRYGSDAAGWSEQRQFRVAPAPGSRPGEPPLR